MPLKNGGVVFYTGFLGLGIEKDDVKVFFHPITFDQALELTVGKIVWFDEGEYFERLEITGIDRGVEELTLYYHDKSISEIYLLDWGEGDKDLLYLVSDEPALIEFLNKNPDAYGAYRDQAK